MGVNFTNSSLFQAMGNTLPALVASATRLLTFLVPTVWLTTWSGFEIRHLWYLSVATVALQAFVSWRLLVMEFKLRLVKPGESGQRAPTAAPG